MKSNLRVDVYKKIATAEGVFTRLPYALKTDRVFVVGFKRMELNTPLRFPHVSESSFDSVFRRCCVIKMKSRFIDRRTHKELVENEWEEGIFVREYDLGDFLKSGPGALAGIIAQHGFESKHSRDDCVDVIAHYVERGGDGGMTWNTMREACGLPPRPPPWERPATHRSRVRLNPTPRLPALVLDERAVTPDTFAHDEVSTAAPPSGYGLALARRAPVPQTTMKTEPSCPPLPADM